MRDFCKIIKTVILSLPELKLWWAYLTKNLMIISLAFKRRSFSSVTRKGQDRQDNKWGFAKVSVKYFTGTLLFLCVHVCCFAQFYPTQYRPPHLNWQQLQSTHFTILFPAGEKPSARRLTHILEKQYPKIRELTGGGFSNFPIILNNYNDRSNGFVTTLHFRSEIDLSPNKGKTLNPETGGWLKNVAPHELVHALQFSHLGGFGLGQMVSFFSPDLARSLHGAVPSGVAEGLAVYHESNGITPGGGRGHYPYFTNQFEALFQSPSSWSMGQMVHVPAYTRPLNRYYIGGYEFTQWLQETYGYHTSRKAIDFNIRWPFLGYGIALKHATGQWPSQLYDAFVAAKAHELTQSKRVLLDVVSILPIPYEGASIRRPRWLSDSTLVFFGSFYNARPGFYRYQLSTQTMHRLVTTGMVQDFNYTLSDDKNTLIFSYYQPDPLYDNVYKAELVKANLTTGTTTQMTDDGRLFAPTFSADSVLFSLKTEHRWTQLVKMDIQPTISIDSTWSVAPHQIIAVAMHPSNPDSMAVVINKEGTQALWLVSRDHLTEDLKQAPTLFFEKGSIFDPVWHPRGGRILFSADFSGRLQIYEYVIQSGRIQQITNAPYNAFEASYSPDGRRIAFTLQRGNEKLPALLPRTHFYGQWLPSGQNQPQPSQANTTPSSPDSSWRVSSYSVGIKWLKPRTFLPIVEEVSSSDEYKIGFGLHSNSLLQQQAYSLQATYFKKKLWYDLRYQNKRFFPGFEARIFNDPDLITLDFSDQQDNFTQTFLRQERSLALSIPVPITLHQNVWYSSLFLKPEIRWSQIRFFNAAGENPSAFSTVTIGNLFGQFGFRLQQNIRDVQPNSGLILYAEVEHYFSFGELSVNTRKGEASLDFAEPTAFRGGIFGYVAPLKRWNQSLRLGVEVVSQTNPVFDSQDIVSSGFSESILPLADNLLSFSARYTIPLFYPDDGGLLVPLYLSNIYLVGFANTVTDPGGQSLLKTSRSVFGAGIRFKFRISNLALDLGIGFGYEPTRQKGHLFIGNF